MSSGVLHNYKWKLSKAPSMLNVPESEPPAMTFRISLRYGFCKICTKMVALARRELVQTKADLLTYIPRVCPEIPAIGSICKQKLTIAADTLIEKLTRYNTELSLCRYI